MKKTMLVALAIALSAGANVALADGSPELNRPFGDRNGPYTYGSRDAAPSYAAAPSPVASDADAYARLQADGYRAIDVARGSDGAWHGTAIHGAAKVGVTVDPAGRIHAQ
jgi:hypothetical protein